MQQVLCCAGAAVVGVGLTWRCLGALRGSGLAKAPSRQRACHLPRASRARWWKPPLPRAGWRSLPQSVLERVLQNLALNKPWHEGVSDAAVMGTLAGMAMGGGAAGVAGFSQPTPEQTPPPNQPAPVPPPVAGPTLALAGPDRGVIQVGGDGGPHACLPSARIRR